MKLFEQPHYAERPPLPESVQEPPLSPDGISPKWDPLPLDNVTPEGWPRLLSTGAFTDTDVLNATKHAVEIVIRGGVPLLAKKEEDGGYTLPIRRVGSLFSIVNRLKLERQGFRRLRISPDGKDISVVSSDSERVPPRPAQLKRKETTGKGFLDFEWKATKPSIKSFKDKLHFVIFS